MTLRRFIAAVALTLTCSTTVSFAQDNKLDSPTIRVIGLGEVKAKPDQAKLVLGAKTKAKDARTAVKENSKVMDGVIKKLKELGVEEKDIRTLEIELERVVEKDEPGEWQGQPDSKKPDKKPQPPIYEASNMLGVTVRDLKRVATLLDEAIAAGADHIVSITFDVANRKGLEAEARKLAVKDCQEKAEQLAKESGVGLGQPVLISDSPESMYSLDGNQSYAFMARNIKTIEVNSQKIPLEPGEIEVTSVVAINYRIE